MTSYDPDEYYDRLEDIGYKTKRQGLIAYDIFGNQIDGFPVFVQKDELIEDGVDPDKL